MNTLTDNDTDVEQDLEEQSTSDLKLPSTIAEEFRERKRKQQISLLPLGFAFLMIAIRDSIPLGSVRDLVQEQTFAFAVIAVLVFFLYSLSNWRCPSCSRYLGQRLFPSKCPHCKVSFVDEEE